MKPTITIIGGGISGLTAAVYLHQKNYKVQILEATDRVGGRIKTDCIEGFKLDRGFQVLLTDYPETKALLDYNKLNLKRFYQEQRYFMTEVNSILPTHLEDQVHYSQLYLRQLDR